MLRADERLYYPLHARPYTPAHRFPRGKNDPAFRTKLQIAVDLARRAPAAGVVFRAVVADCAYGDHDTFRGTLAAAGLAFVIALKPHRGSWAYGPDAYTPVDAARELAWGGPDDPGDWTPVTRTFRHGHTATWWAADARLGWWGPDGTTRLVVATTDPARLPATSTWYVATNLPRPGSARAIDSPHPAADLAELVRLYGIRNWIEQSYKQVKDELGWADFQVRSDLAIRRHQTLVNCAFSFCWNTWFTGPRPATPESAAAEPTPRERGTRNHPAGPAVVAGNTAHGPQLADPRDRVPPLVASLVHTAPPAELQTLIAAVGAGHGLPRYPPPSSNKPPVISRASRVANRRSSGHGPSGDRGTPTIRN